MAHFVILSVKWQYEEWNKLFISIWEFWGFTRQKVNKIPFLYYFALQDLNLSHDKPKSFMGNLYG